MSIPTKQQIAEKQGLNYYVCECGNDVYSKYKLSKPTCETCKYALKVKRANRKYHKKRINKLLEKESDKFKVKLVVNKLKQIQLDCNISRDELERIFITFT